MVLLLQNVYGTRDCEDRSSVTSRKDIIMQNCSVKPLQAGRFHNAELFCEEVEEYDTLV
jgi:hypothetical protein